ncbi:hypothetical protein BJX96DRAFT_98545 [Aspergillus floccosus]
MTAMDSRHDTDDDDPRIHTVLSDSFVRVTISVFLSFPLFFFSSPSVLCYAFVFLHDTLSLLRRIPLSHVFSPAMMRITNVMILYGHEMSAMRSAQPR